MPAHGYFSEFQPENAGFTFVELLISMAIVAVIMTFAAMSLSNLIPKAQLRTALSQVIVDVQNQQYLAMIGQTDPIYGQVKGVYFEDRSYTVFNGTNYEIDNPSNFEVSIPETAIIRNITLPDNTLIFAPLSGVCQNCPVGEEVGLELGDDQSSARAEIVVNSYGVLEIKEYQ